MMEKIIQTITKMFNFINTNKSDISLYIGICLILRHILLVCGFNTMLFSIGILLIIYSILIEINKK